MKTVNMPLIFFSTDDEKEVDKDWDDQAAEKPIYEAVETSEKTGADNQGYGSVSDTGSLNEHTSATEVKQPAEAPPTEMPPVAAPPTEAPPVTGPPTEAPPAGDPPAQPDNAAAEK